MSLFVDVPLAAPARPPRRRGRAAGWSFLAVAFLILGGLALSPSPYVVQQPGPVFDTLGTVTIGEDGEEVPLIEIDGAETFDTEGSLDMLTVSVVGTPDERPTWFEVVVAWFDESKAVLPIESVYPAGVTTEQRDEENEALMASSQQTSVAAALGSLGYEFDQQVVVGSVAEGSPAEGELETGDVLVRANGADVTDVTTLREIINDNGVDSPVTFDIVRGGEETVVDVTPAEQTLDDGSSGGIVVGIVASGQYDFPFDVSIQLEDVGGPSAGMMFALGIIDKLTEGSLTGGEIIAGTGTVDASGAVGPIGGIRQKLFGAADAGAQVFLAPTTNCDEVVGHVPDGLQVFAVSTIDDSLAVLDAVRSGDGLDELPSCESVTSP